MTTARTIVTRALGELVYLAEGESPSHGEISDGLDALNSMITSWRLSGMMISYPSGTTWKGDWDTNIYYAVNEAVNVSGRTFTCSAVHTSSAYDKPGGSANWQSYWTENTDDTTLALADDFPLPAPFERGVISMLAVELGPILGKNPSPLTMKKASEGMTALLAAYMPIRPVTVDNGLVRMPSQIWPYSISSTS